MPANNISQSETTDNQLTIKVKAGNWVGEGVFLNSAGEERNLRCAFTVKASQIEVALCLYIHGRYVEGYTYQGQYFEKLDISDNQFSMELFYGKFPNFQKVYVKGEFISSEILHGTFVTPEGKGEWKAKPK